MRDLWLRARAGDRAARELLIERHMPLARSLAVQYRHAREPLDDLCQVANLGLVKAVDRFDPDRGIAFTSYAVPTILGELKRHFRDRTWAIHMSRSVQESIARVEKAPRRCASSSAAARASAEVAERCGMNVEDVTEARLAENASRLASLDAPVQREDGDLADLLGRSDTGLSRVEDALWIEQLAGETDAARARNPAAAVRRGPGQREIAERVGISQMHVSRICARRSRTSPTRRSPSSAMSSSRAAAARPAAGRRSRRGSPLARGRRPRRAREADVERAPARLDQAVGEQPQRLAGREVEAARAGTAGAAEARAAGSAGRRRSRAPAISAGQVAGAGQLALAGGGVEHDVDDRGERDRAREAATSACRSSMTSAGPAPLSA